MSLVLTEGLPLVPIHLRDSVPVLWALIFVPIQSHLPFLLPTLTPSLTSPTDQDVCPSFHLQSCQDVRSGVPVLFVFTVQNPQKLCKH